MVVRVARVLGFDGYKPGNGGEDEEMRGGNGSLSSVFQAPASSFSTNLLAR